jgi:hypothetical protein
MEKFVIMDMVGKENAIATIYAKNGKSALKKFLQSHCMNTGIYEIKKDYFWYMVSSFGSYFRALPVKE